MSASVKSEFPHFISRGVWHLHPTTLNEAVDASGKQDLISRISQWVSCFTGVTNIRATACIVAAI